MTINPIVINPIADQDIIVGSNSDGVTINLKENFDDPSTTGLLALFSLRDQSINNGLIKVLLFDQAGSGAPLTVENFINYVNSGAYNNSIIHRSVPGFVIQGGGFTVEQLRVNPIPTDPPVQNEFSPVRSNTRGTIAMAKLGGDPNSATSQWFFNLADNNSPNNPNSLDRQNGGFTVFGQVLDSADLRTIDTIASIRRSNLGTVNPAFTDIPLLQNPPTNDNSFVLFNGIFLQQTEELQFIPTGNSNPALVNVSVNGSDLTINYTPGQSGKSEITVSATTLLGESIESRFVVTVVDPIEYGASNPDLIAAFGYNPEAFSQHYLSFGKTEGRSIDSFDQKRYLASYDDLLDAFGNNPEAAAVHYVQAGATIENRPLYPFDPSQYLASYDDLLNAFGSDTAQAQDHFLYSWANERRARDRFQEDIYLASYSDLIDAFAPLNSYSAKLQAATEHFINYGFSEERARQIFDPVAYLNKYSDLKAAFGNNLAAATEHYIEHGFSEERTWT